MGTTKRGLLMLCAPVTVPGCMHATFHAPVTVPASLETFMHFGLVVLALQATLQVSSLAWLSRGW